jgi:hypothetical protein
LKLLQIILFSITLISAEIEPPLSIGSISFKDAGWGTSENISYSRKRISEITADNKAVIINFFQLMFC